jgi:uncharacterized protein DUF3105
VSKESRRRQRMAGQPSGSGPGPSSAAPRDAAGRPAERSGGSRPSTGPRGTERAGRRDRARAVTRGSFVERYRTWLLGAAIAVVLAVVGAGVFAAATQPAYACSTIWEPSPTASPDPGASPQLGYVQPDMGRGHLPPGTQVRYTYCPPASGKHYAAADQGPIPARIYGPSDGALPDGWVHNLEHGGLVILYRGAEADQTALQALFEAIPPSPVCGLQPGGKSPSPVIARFDQMAWPYAALLWDLVLPMQTLDQAAVLDFYARNGERTNPEQQCPPPSALPSDAASGSPETSASPSAAPSAAPSTAAPSAPSS